MVAAYFDLADAIITVRSLIREAWTTHRWDTRPGDAHDHRPIRATSKSARAAPGRRPRHVDRGVHDGRRPRERTCSCGRSPQSGSYCAEPASAHPPCCSPVYEPHRRQVWGSVRSGRAEPRGLVVSQPFEQVRTKSLIVEGMAAGAGGRVGHSSVLDDQIREARVPRAASPSRRWRGVRSRQAEPGLSRLAHVRGRHHWCSILQQPRSRRCRRFRRSDGPAPPPGPDACARRPVLAEVPPLCRLGRAVLRHRRTPAPRRTGSCRWRADLHARCSLPGRIRTPDPATAAGSTCARSGPPWRRRSSAPRPQPRRPVRHPQMLRWTTFISQRGDDDGDLVDLRWPPAAGQILPAPESRRSHIAPANSTRSGDWYRFGARSPH